MRLSGRTITHEGVSLRIYTGLVPILERNLIEGIRRRAQRRAPGVVRGIGDDCAVLRPPRGHELLVTTDFSVENVHFRRAWHKADVVGHRCLTRGLSDIAAMGGEPLAAFLSLALPSNIERKWVDGFFNGLLALADRWKVPLAGGDIAQSMQGVVADIVVLGSVPRGKAVLRSTARAGDIVYVSGKVGWAVEGLLAFREGKKPTPRSDPRHFYPEPRVEVGRFLRERKLATAMIDLSDGLSTDLSHICEESGVGAVVYAEALPRTGSLEWALNGGDDYELLFTARAKTTVPDTIAGVPITPIGEVIGRNGMWLADPRGKQRPLKPGGWEHFREDAK